MNNDAVAGQAIYSKRILSIYDLWVLGVSNHLFWKCPTRLISHQFRELVSVNHLDVGVGSGYYLKKHLPHKTKRVALVDLNKNSLESTSKSIESFNPEIYCRNILEPLDLESNKFDSVSLNYLLHCLPGDIASKSIAFQNIKQLMNDDGIVFGSTILGTDIPKNVLATKLMAFYNKKGIFSNTNDGLTSLDAALNDYFTDVRIEVVGCVALFSGRVSR